MKHLFDNTLDYADAPTPSEILGIDTSILPIDEVERLLIKRAFHSPIIPKTWNVSRSMASYYRLKYARLLKEVLDKMHEDTSKSMFFSSKVYGLSRHTLSTMISQAWIFLIYNIDPIRKYRQMRSSISCHTHKDGVLLEWKDITTITAQPQEIDSSETGKFNQSPSKTFLGLKEDLQKFVEIASDEDVFYKTGLRIGPEEIEWVNLFIGPLKEFHIMLVNGKAVKVCRSTSIQK